jgi:hypothetical protein
VLLEDQIYNEGVLSQAVSGDRGFCIVPALLTSHGIAQFRAELDDVLGRMPDAWLHRHSARTEDGSYVSASSLDTPSEFFFRVSRAQILLDLGRRFAGKAVTPLCVEYFDRPRGLASGTPPHQDQSFFKDFFPDEVAITFWVALDDTSPANGAMHMRPTRDRICLPHVRSRVLGFGMELADGPDLSEYEPVCLRAGDALMHASYTPHYCPPNTSDRSRRAITITFRTSSYREVWGQAGKGDG